MCWMLQEETEVAVKSILATMLEGGKPFTGLDIYQQLGTTPEDARAVSGFVREQFNLGEMPGWASTQVVPGTGPVLYFKVLPTSTAGKKVKEIKLALGGK